MQTTNAAARIAGRIGKAAVIVAVAVLVNVVLTFALEPYGSVTEATWYEYRTMPREQIDTVVVGTSYASFGVSPTELDKELGSSSYNLSTMAQTLPNSLGVIRRALKEHPVKRVVLCIGSESLQNYPQYDREVAFLQVKSLGEPLPDVLQNVATIALDELNYPTSKSLSWVFPWSYDTVELTPEAIATNIRRRLQADDPTQIIVERDQKWRYEGRGHCAYDDHMDVGGITRDKFTTQTNDPFLQKNVRELTELMDACADVGVPLYLVVAPRFDFEILSHQDEAHVKLMQELQGMAQQHGACYLDLNLAKSDFYRPLQSDFADIQHLNVEGSHRFSAALGKLMKRIEERKSIDDLMFTYDQWDEYLASYDDLALCVGDYELQQDGVLVQAEAITAPNVRVEYAFDVQDDATGKPVAKQEYGASNTMRVPLEGHGSLTVVARARVAGTTSPDERSCHFTISY